MGKGTGSTDAFRRDYLPYGEALTEAGADEDMPYQFTGKELDNNAAGLYYFGARYYMPGIGRWLVPDALAGKYPAWSPYNYVFDNPGRYTDPTDRDTTKVNDDGKGYSKLIRSSWSSFRVGLHLSRTGKEQLGKFSKDGKHINVSLDGKITH